MSPKDVRWLAALQELNPTTKIPGWVEMRERLKESGIRLMSYINPFLVDPAEKGQCRRNLYKEAADQGFLIKNAAGEPYQILNTSFSAALVDLANPDACDWLKSVIREQLIETGVSGWMADFGEALPFDAKLHDDVDAAVFHNEYPEVWARINREAVQEAGLDDEIVFFIVLVLRLPDTARSSGWVTSSRVGASKMVSRALWSRCCLQD